MIRSRADRIWLAWRVLRGFAVSFRADGRSFTIDFDYSGAEFKRLRRSAGHARAQTG